jgi:hypothetical protein
MLDRKSLHALARRPEQNDPILNVALAEEGDIVVLLALADCRTTGPEALSRIGERIQTEGDRVGATDEPELDDESPRASRRSEETKAPSFGSELDRRLVVHARADDALRDAVLARHEDDPFFLLAAAAHRHATETAVSRIVAWPSTTPLHDRTWLGLIDPRAVSPLTIAGWASDDDELLREAAARVTEDSNLLEALSRDRARRVRRAVAGNSHVSTDALARLRSDAACEVRARAGHAGGTLSISASDAGLEAHGAEVTSARFKAAAANMLAGGTVASDVARALRTEPLDAEGARWAARALDDAAVGELVSAHSHSEPIARGFAAGIAFRDLGEGQDAGVGLLAQCVRALAEADRSGSMLTGKGRLANWLADGVAHVAEEAPGELIEALGADTLAADRMVLGRVGGANFRRVASICERALQGSSPLPIALLEVAWHCPEVPDDALEKLAARVAKGDADASLEHEVDLDPRKRPLSLLERVGVILVGKAPLSPRAALSLVALEPRRVRYILSALPQWKGVLSGANVARVLKAHAGALSAAGPSPQRRPTQAAASWTQRRLDEVELAVALAVCDISPAEALKRITAGYAVLNQGPALASGLEARATLEGSGVVEPLVDYLAGQRSRDAAVLAAWLLIEGLDRTRSPTAIAAALDAPWVAPQAAAGSATAASRSMVPLGLSEALATLERRSPGRLAAATPQTPRGRAALASGIARAYRALGGMAVTES